MLDLKGEEKTWWKIEEKKKELAKENINAKFNCTHG